MTCSSSETVLRKFYYQSVKERGRLDVGGLWVPGVQLVRRSIQRVPALIYFLNKKLIRIRKKNKHMMHSIYLRVE